MIGIVNRPSLNSAFLAFLQHTAKFGGKLGVPIDPESIHFLDAPTEALVDEVHNGSKKSVAQLFQRRRGIVGPARNAGKARLEENYLYSTRRFPSAANNTIGAGAIAVGRHSFFNQPLGGDGTVMGFPTGFTLAESETNMEGTAGTIAQGQNFVFNQIGVSFNSDASGADVAQLMDAGGLIFTKAGGQFSLIHGPARLWPGGTGVEGYAAAATTVAATTVNTNVGHNGSGDIRAVRNLKIPRVLKEKETFSYLYAVARATKATDGTAFALSNFALMTIWLWGGSQIAIPL